MPPAADRTVAYRAVLLAAGLLVLGLLFEQLITLLVAVLITVIIAIGLSAFAHRLERYGLPRPLGALIGLLLGVGIIVGVLALIIPPFIDQTNQFVDNVPGIVDDLRRQVADLTGSEPGAGGRPRPGLRPPLYRPAGAPDRADHVDSDSGWRGSWRRWCWC